MKKALVTLLFAIGIVILFFGVQAVATALHEVDPAPVEETVRLEPMKSVVIEDGRSVCDKKSQIMVSKLWIDTCAATDIAPEPGTPYCLLSKTAADNIRNQQVLFLQSCSLNE